MIPKRVAALWVESRCGLIEEQHFWFMDEGRDKVKPPSHAAGKRANLLLGDVRQPDELQ